MKRKLGLIFLLCAVVWSTFAAAQSLGDLNQRAVSAFNAGDLVTARTLTQQAVDQGADAGRADPAAYLEALNNLTYLGTLGEPPYDEVVDQAGLALGFARTTDQPTPAGLLTALSNAAQAAALVQDRDASRAYRAEMLATARQTEWHGQTLASAVDLAFANRDHTELPSLMAEMNVVAGGYFAQTSLEQLFERQVSLERQGDVDGVTALVDARIALVGILQPDLLEEFAHAALWQKFFMNFQAERFGAAADGLREWAATGKRSADETAFVVEQAEQALLLTQLGGYGDRDSVQLGYAELTFAFAQIAYAPDDHRIGLALREIAAAQGLLGQYEVANETLQDAILNLTLTAEGQLSIFLVLEDLASNAWQRGDLDQAKSLFEQASLAYQFAIENGVAPLAAFDQSVLALNRARLLIEAQDLAQAEQALAQAAQAFDAYVAGGTAKPNDLWHHVSLAQGRALLAAEGGDLAAIRGATLDAVTAANTYYPSGHPRRAMVLTNAADQLFVIGDAETAVALLDDARSVAIAALPPDAPLRADIEVKLAVAALARGDRDAAIGYLRHVAEARRSPEHRVTLASVSYNFELLAWALLNQPAPDEATIDEALAALQWTQVSHSAEALAMMEARLSAADPQIAVLLKRRQDILGDLDLNRSALNASYASGENTGDILDRQRLLARDAQAADEALRHAGIDHTGQAPIVSIGLRDIQALLQPDEVLVTFLLPGLIAEAVPGLDGSSNMAIAIRQNGYLIAQVGEATRGGLNQAIDAFRCEMAISDEGCGAGVNQALRGSMNLAAETDQSLGFDWTVAHGLYQDLFGGIEPILRDQDRLIIVPPSDLLRLPFQAMITKLQPDFDLGRADWLVRHHPISVLPSIAALNALRSNDVPRSDGLRILGVGDPVIGTGPDLDCSSFELASLRSAIEPAQNLYAPRQDGLRLANTQQLRSLSRLPDATCELQAIEAAFGADQSDLMLRGDATEAGLKALDEAGQLAQYDLLIFATHGVIAGETSAIAPGLVLTPPDSASVRDDGLLTAAEIATFTLSARLVILSACNTAAGRAASDEGLSGLASGFFQAGARSLMVTHWAVFSSASAEISTRVAEALAEDSALPNAVALQRAVLNILDDSDRPLQAKHPAYWAPFAIVGD